MTDRQLTEKLKNYCGDPPESFHRALQKTAEHLLEHEKSVRKKRLRFSLVTALCLLLFGTAAAVIQRSDVFNFYKGAWEEYEYTLPEAENMVQTHLCEQKTGNLLWQVKEAVYDGRVMRILFSVTDTKRNIPWTEEEKAEEAPLMQLDRYYEEMTKRENLSLMLFGNGSIFVNGQNINLWACDARYGEKAGEIEFFIDSWLQYYDGKEYQVYKPRGMMKIEMPFISKNGGDAPPPLTFYLDGSDNAEKYQVPLPEKMTLPDGAVLEFTDLHFSPATFILDYQVTVSRRLLPVDFPYTREEALTYEIEREVFIGDQWTAEGLYNSRGEKLGHNKDFSYGLSAVLENGDAVYVYHTAYTPDDRLTNPVYLRIGAKGFASCIPTKGCLPLEPDQGTEYPGPADSTILTD